MAPWSQNPWKTAWPPSHSFSHSHSPVLIKNECANANTYNSSWVDLCLTTDEIIESLLDLLYFSDFFCRICVNLFRINMNQLMWFASQIFRLWSLCQVLGSRTWGALSQVPGLLWWQSKSASGKGSGSWLLSVLWLASEIQMAAKLADFRTPT